MDKKKLSVRQAEQIAKQLKDEKFKFAKKKDPNILDLQKTLEEKMGLSVSINNKKNNTGNKNISNLNNKSKIRLLLEKVKILKDKVEESQVEKSHAPAEYVYLTAPAETKIVYREAPAESKIVYREAPAETVYVEKEVYKTGTAATCEKGEIANNQKLFGVEVKKNKIIEKIYKLLDNNIYKQVSIVFILLTFFAIYIKRRR